MKADLERIQPEPYVLAKCKHCGYPMGFLYEANDNYNYACQNKQCKVWCIRIAVPKTKLAEKLASG